MSDRQARLDELMRESVEDDLVVLLAAKEKAKTRMDQDPTTANVAAFKAASEALREARGQGEAAAAGERTFKNKLQVTAFLNERGWQVGKSKVYADAKAGQLAPRADGLFHEADVLAYARDADLPQSTVQNSRPDGETEAARQRKLISEADEAAVTLELKRIKLAREQGLVVPLDDYNDDMASAALILRQGLVRFCETRARQVIHLAKGDPRTEDAVREYMQRECVALLHGFSKRRTHEIAREDLDAAR